MVYLELNHYILVILYILHCEVKLRIYWCSSRIDVIYSNCSIIKASRRELNYIIVYITQSGLLKLNIELLWWIMIRIA